MGDQIWVYKWDGWGHLLLVSLSVFIFASLGLGLGRECKGPIVAWGSCCWPGGWATCPQFPLGWFKADAAVGHMALSLASVALEIVDLGGQLHPLALHWVLDSLAHCPDPLHLLPHTPSEECWPVSSGQAHLYCCESLDNYCCHLSCTQICGYILGTTEGAGMTIASSSLGQGSH